MKDPQGEKRGRKIKKKGPKKGKGNQKDKRLKWVQLGLMLALI